VHEKALVGGDSHSSDVNMLKAHSSSSDCVSLGLSVTKVDAGWMITKVVLCIFYFLLLLLLQF
jgi:hypothetical protein